MLSPIRTLMAGAVLAGAAHAAHADDAEVTEAAEAAEAADVATSLPQQLLFEHNGGRYDEAVAYVARGRGLTLFACPDAVVLSLDGSAGASAAAVHTTFIGGNLTPSIVGVTERMARVHHLRGNDRAQWSVDNATFSRVRYEQLWPGIDLELYDAAGELEYDFVLAPGVDPDRVRLRFDGADDVSIAADGDLIVTTPAGDLRQSAPVVYQHGPAGREPVEGRFVLHADDVVGFAIEDYDEQRTLVIDPVLSYATYVTGSAAVHITDIAVDADGHAYFCGYTQSPDLPTTAGVLQPAHADTNADDAFIGKLSPDGTQMLWLTYLGGSGPTGANCCAPDQALTIGVDGLGNVVVGGWTATSDFPQVNPFDIGSATSGFVSKLLPDGSGLVFSSYVGGGINGAGVKEAVRALAVDDTGNVWITGTHGGVDPLAVTPGTVGQFADDFGAHGYAMRLDPAGDVVWATYLTGISAFGQPIMLGVSVPDTRCQAIAVDADERVYIAGHTNTSDFPIVNAADATAPTSNADTEFFLTRLSADATAIEYSTFLGGSSNESNDRMGVACLDDGHVWLAGGSNSTDYPTTPGAYDTVAGGGNEWDGVVTCIDTDQAGPASLVYSTYFGGFPNERFNDVAVDAAGNAHLVGWTDSASYPVMNAWQSQMDGANSGVLTVLDGTGHPLRSTFFGRGGAVWADEAALALGPDGDVWYAFTTNDQGLATPGAAEMNATPLSYSGMVTRWRMADPVCQTDLGFAGPGTATLSMCGGDLSTGVFSRLRLDSDGDTQFTWFMVGATADPTFASGVGGTIVPVPVQTLLALTTDSLGDIELLVPGGFPGATLYVQCAVADATTPHGWALSNALQVDWLP